MWILGVTGAIGAGKSTLSEQFESLGIPVHCADREIHSLLEKDESVQERINSLFPHVFTEGKINKILLGDYVLSLPSQLILLEEILYPKLAHSQKTFLKYHQQIKTKFVVLDVPLLLEVGLDPYCHYVIVVDAPFSLRKSRILRRRGMTLEKFKKFESNQFSEDIRRRCADFIIPTGRSKRSSLQKIKEILFTLSQKPAPSWQGEWPDTFKKELNDKRNCS